MDNAEKIAQFVAITGAEPGQAEYLLEASGWDMDSAVQLHFETSHAGAGVDDEEFARQMMQEDMAGPAMGGLDLPEDGPGLPPAVDHDGVRVPDAVRTERLFDVGPGMMAARPVRARREAVEGAGINLSDQADGGLDAIYKPPQAIMNDLTLEELKMEAERQDQWIIVNVQDTSVFQSLQLNADLWHDNLLQDLITSNFQFAQRTLPSEDAVQLQSSYHLHALPAILIIDPNTGQKMHEWTGLPDKERFMEALVPFLDTAPSNPKAGSLVSASVKQATFQTTAPVPTGAAGVAGISDDDEAMAKVIAASLSDRPSSSIMAASAGPSTAGAADEFEAQLQQAMAQSLGAGEPAPVEAVGAAVSAAPAAPAQHLPPDTGEAAPTANADELIAAAQARLAARPEREATCRVALQLPQARLVEKFAPEDTVQSVYDVALLALPADKAAQPFVLVSASAAGVKLDDMLRAIGDASLHGSLLRLAWL